MNKIFLLVMSMFLGACAYTSQEAELAPSVDIEASNIGAGKQVALKVVDERTTKTLGHRGSAFIKGAKITTDQDVASVFFGTLQTALAKLGFTTVAFTPGDENSLRVDIRELNYYTSTGFWTGGVHTKAAAKVTAGEGSYPFEKVYTSEGEKRVVFVPGADKNTATINATLSDLITKIVTDQELVEFLTRDKQE